MVVTRSGKKTTFLKKIKKPNKEIKLKELTIRLKRFSPDELQSLSKTSNKRYNLRSRNAQAKSVQSLQTNRVVEQPVKSRQIANFSVSNSIWNTLTNTYQFNAMDIVLAKMASFRPWPCRINSVYKVGNITKCFVLFYGTFQIGSVLKSQYVNISVCDQYLFHTVKEIKSKYKWDCVDYESISKSDDIQRGIALVKLTQIQKFFLAIRDIEREKKVPYDLSMVRSRT